jgi:hypothetical protein
MQYTFYRENSDFDDILKDPNVKKYVDEVTTWYQHLMIDMSDYDKDIDKVKMYITLKYGDDLCQRLTKDYSPVINVDYIPVRK